MASGFAKIFSRFLTAAPPGVMICFGAGKTARQAAAKRFRHKTARAEPGNWVDIFPGAEIMGAVGKPPARAGKKYAKGKIMGDSANFVMLIVGVSAFAGILGAWAFQRLRIPQVVGYIVIGALAGDTAFGLIHAQHIESLRTFNMLALGVIGFLVGGELKISEFRKYFRQFMAMLLGEGLGAFILVGLSSAAVVYLVSGGNFKAAVAAGAVFGAIASATDPASTIDVLWEYRCRGKFTTAVIAIIALDDALAMSLYGIGKGVAQIITGKGGSVSAELLAVGKELGGALVLGAIIGATVAVLLRRIHQKERKVALSVGAILLIIGIAAVNDLDVILASMTAGFLITNMEERRSADLFSLLRSFSIPIYVLFFVLIGARLNIKEMPQWLWLLAGLYVVFRTLGKFTGTWIGARLSHAGPVIEKYAGLALFTQGGVAVGLSIMASSRLGDIMIVENLSLGSLIIFTVTATTLTVQLIGPPMVKWTATRAGEVGRNITEEDLLASWTVADALIGRTPPTVSENEPVEILAQRFADGGYSMFAVADENGKAVGMVSFAGMRDIFADQECWQWLVAADVMKPLGELIYPETKLADAVEALNGTKDGELLAVQRTGEPLGVLSERTVRQVLAEELLRTHRSGESARMFNAGEKA